MKADVWIAVSFILAAFLGSMVLNIFWYLRYIRPFKTGKRGFTGVCRDCQQIHDEGWRCHCRVCRDIRRLRYKEDKKERNAKVKEKLAWPKL